MGDCQPHSLVVPPFYSRPPIAFLRRLWRGAVSPVDLSCRHSAGRSRFASEGLRVLLFIGPAPPRGSSPEASPAPTASPYPPPAAPPHPSSPAPPALPARSRFFFPPSAAPHSPAEFCFEFCFWLCRELGFGSRGCSTAGATEIDRPRRVDPFKDSAAWAAAADPS